MSPDDAKNYIIEKICVQRQKVTVAKGFVLKNFEPNTDGLIHSFLSSVGVEMPIQVVLHRTIDPIPVLDGVADYISWKLALCEAIWGLISTGSIFPASSRFCGETTGIQYTTVVPGSGGQSGGIQFPELSLLVPGQLAWPPSSVLDAEQPITDPDVYLHELSLPNLPPQIESALREAVKCFRHDLYLSCLTMLVRASEGAWIELGLSLARAAPGLGYDDQTKLDQITEKLESPFVGIAQKIRIVLQQYEDQATFSSLAKESGVKLQEIRDCANWTDCVRESRNSIHYGVNPAMTNRYEKVGVLLIGAVPHIKTLCSLTVSASKALRPK